MALSLVDFLGKVIIDFSPINKLSNEEHVQAVKEVFARVVSLVFAEVDEVHSVKVVAKKRVESSFFNKSISEAQYVYEVDGEDFVSGSPEIADAIYFSENYEVIVNIVGDKSLSMFFSFDPVYVSIVPGYTENFGLFA